MEIKRKSETVAVIVSAGSGSRMRRVTKGGAKELVPVQDGIPSIGYSILEALENGVTDIVIVSNKSKIDLENWLQGREVGSNGNPVESLEKILERAGNPEGVNIDVVYQDIPLGLGHAVLSAKQSKLLKDHDGKVYVLLPDEVFVDKKNPQTENIGKLDFAGELLASDHSLVLTMTVPKEDQGRYGIAVLDESYFVKKFVEKPKTKDGILSCEAIAGRYFLSTNIFEHLQKAFDAIVDSLRKAAELNHEVEVDLSGFDYTQQVGSSTIKIQKGSCAFKSLLAETIIDMSKSKQVGPNDAIVAASILKQVLAIEIDGKPVGELQLTDSIQTMLADGENVGIVSLPDDCMRLDIGTAEGYETALVEIEDLVEVANQRIIGD